MISKLLNEKWRMWNAIGGLCKKILGEMTGNLYPDIAFYDFLKNVECNRIKKIIKSKEFWNKFDASNGRISLDQLMCCDLIQLTDHLVKSFQYTNKEEIKYALGTCRIIERAIEHLTIKQFSIF